MTAHEVINNIVPTVNNGGYEAVFTPADTENYETVTRTVTVTVKKAVPYIAVLPTAAGITYGDALGASALSGGTAQYGDGSGKPGDGAGQPGDGSGKPDDGAGQPGDGSGQPGDGAGSLQTVAGIFAWKEPSLKPAVADSGKTAYVVAFTPSDTENYENVELGVTLTVERAENAPNMPAAFMSVPYSNEKVVSVTLPEGWKWQEEDKNKALEAGVAVSAVAVYAGADKGNYEKETVTVTLTRSSCDHEAGDILYTGTGDKDPACTEEGLGHRECTKCHAVVESGITVPALGHTGGTATCSERAVCTRCSQPYGGLAAHTYATAWKSDGSIHWHECECGEKSEKADHSYGEWRITVSATPGADGTKERSCVICGSIQAGSVAYIPGGSGDGDIYNATDPGSNACAADITVTKQEIVEKLGLTPQELAAVENHADIRVYLVVADAAGTVPAKDRELAMQQLEALTLQQGTPDVKAGMGMFLDITLFKQVGSGDKVPVGSTNGMITITFQMPESLINRDPGIQRTYYVIRVHGGKADVIDGRFDAVTGTYSFETDRFSSYGVVCIDRKAGEDGQPDSGTSGSEESGSPQPGGNGNEVLPAQRDDEYISPRTGETDTWTVWAILLLPVAAIAGIFFKRKKGVGSS